MLYRYVLLTCFGQVWHIGINEKEFTILICQLPRKKQILGEKCHTIVCISGKSENG